MIAPFGIEGNAHETTNDVAVTLEYVGADGLEGAEASMVSFENILTTAFKFSPASSVLKTTGTLAVLVPAAVLACMVNE